MRENLKQEYGFQTRQRVREGAGSGNWEELMACVGRLFLCSGGSTGPAARSKARYRRLMWGQIC